MTRKSYYTKSAFKNDPVPQMLLVLSERNQFDRSSKWKQIVVDTLTYFYSWFNRELWLFYWFLTWNKTTMKEKRQEPHCAWRGGHSWFSSCPGSLWTGTQNSKTNRSKFVLFIYLFYYLMGHQNFEICINFNSTYEN